MGDTRLFKANDKERTGWQLATVRELEQLLTCALREGLPAAWWSVRPGYEMTAEFGPYPLEDEPHPRDAWQTWVDALGAEPRPERVSGSGEHRLIALARVGVRGRVAVNLVAHWWDRDGEDA